MAFFASTLVNSPLQRWSSMSLRVTANWGFTMVLLLSDLVMSAMVLPRPPSFVPNYNNYVQRKSGYEVVEPRDLEDGSPNALFQNTNVEKPETENFRLLEIELQGSQEESVAATDIHGVIRAILQQQQQHQQQQQQHHQNRDNQRNHHSLDEKAGEGKDDEAGNEMEETDESKPEIIPHSILGVRDFGNVPNFRSSVTFTSDQSERKPILLPPVSKLHPRLHEKLYYVKNGKPKVYVNVRGHSGNFRRGELDSFKTTRFNDTPGGYLRMTEPFEYHTERGVHKKAQNEGREKSKSKSRYPEADKSRPKRKESDAFVLNDDFLTTENTVVTSSELPKQIPAPPRKVPTRTLVVQTTPGIQQKYKYISRRTDILPGYGFAND